MIRVILHTSLGIGLSCLGVYVFYVYLSGINTGTSPLLLLLALVIIGGGVFFFVKAGQMDDTVMAKAKIDESSLPLQPSFEDKLKKNDAMIEEWSDTNIKRDRLKMLEIAGTNEKSPS